MQGWRTAYRKNKKKSSYVAHTKEVVLRGAHKRSRPMWRTQKEVVLRGAHKKKSSDVAHTKETVLCGVQEIV